LSSFFEILIISVMMNYLLAFFWNTRALDTFIGLSAFITLYALSSWLDFPVLHQILILLTNVALIAVIVIFQPELRVALSKLSFKGRRYKEIQEFDQFLDSLAKSVYNFSDKGIGALIAIENEDSLEEFGPKGVLMHARFSAELLESIFITSTPLHDGAVLMREKEIIAAAAILPLTQGSGLAKSMGTRHRAAIGLSEISDAIVIVVSEETHYVSVARDGILTKNIKIDRFKAILRSIFAPERHEHVIWYQQIIDWFRQ
jgi:diadenylate cyclase